MVENLNYRDPARLDAVFSAVRGIDDARTLISRGPEAIANRVYAIGSATATRRAATAGTTGARATSS